MTTEFDTKILLITDFGPKILLITDFGVPHWAPPYVKICLPHWWKYFELFWKYHKSINLVQF